MLHGDVCAYGDWDGFGNDFVHLAGFRTGNAQRDRNGDRCTGVAIYQRAELWDAGGWDGVAAADGDVDQHRECGAEHLVDHGAGSELYLFDHLPVDRGGGRFLHVQHQLRAAVAWSGNGEHFAGNQQQFFDVSGFDPAAGRRYFAVAAPCAVLRFAVSFGDVYVLPLLMMRRGRQVGERLK